MIFVLTALEWICILAGSFFLLASGIGILRFPDLFTRFHAAGVADTLGAGLILLGLMLQTIIDSGFSLVFAKLVLILLFLMVTSPSSTHALAKAAIHGGVKPKLDKPKH